jgi:hypothetical protein
LEYCDKIAGRAIWTDKNLHESIPGPQRRLEKTATAGDTKKVTRRLLWPFSKPESEEVLSAIERQKLSLLLALENNHTQLSLAIQRSTSAGLDAVLSI